MPEEFKAYTSKFKIISEQQHKILQDALKKRDITTAELIQIGKRHKINRSNVIDFLESQRRLNQSMWNDFFSNAEETIKRIMLNNDYAMVCYIRSKEMFGENKSKKVKLGD